MAKASDNPFPSILIAEGTEPTAPASGYQRLYIDSTTHMLKRTDSSGTDVTIGGAAGAVPTVKAVRTAGDLAVTQTTPQALATGTTAGTGLDLVIPAVSGDWVEVGISGLWSAGDVVDKFGTLTFGTIVSAALVRYINSGNTTMGNGVLAWFAPVASTNAAGGLFAVSGSTTYQVQASDLSGGNLTLRLYGMIGGAAGGSRTLRAASDPLSVWVKNLRQ